MHASTVAINYGNRMSTKGGSSYEKVDTNSLAALLELHR